MNLHSFYSDTGQERVGFILEDESIVEVENIAPNDDGFDISGRDLLTYLNQIQATWHTHPGQTANLSANDYHAFRNYPHLKHYIVGNDGIRRYKVEKGVVLND